MTTYNKIKEIIKKGGVDVVVQEKNNKIIIFSSIMSNGHIRDSGWFDSIKDCKEWIGDNCFTKEQINESSKKYKWKIIKTIAKQSNYKIGDKITVRKTGKVETIESFDNCSVGYNIYTKNNCYNEKEIEPYFNKEEEMVTIQISKKSLEGIKNYKIVK